MEHKEGSNLIQCGDHLWAPYAIVCVHLLTGESREWELIPLGDEDTREIDGDFLCPSCADIHQEINEAGRDYTEDEIDKLRPVCIHCCRRLRKRYDLNYKDEE